MKKEVLGINIDDVSIEQATKIVRDWLQKRGKHYIVTPNPEIIMMAQQDQELKSIINNADLIIPDGIGLKLFTDIVMTTPGIDLLEELIKLAANQGLTIGFLGGRDQVAKKAAECLLRKYPKLKVTFAQSGGKVDKHCDLLFVALGAPKQEKWIANNLPKLSVKVAMAVGGSLDYISGRVPRAPRLIRSIGLEWLFRLIIEPWRIKRQLALVKYLLLMLR